MYSIVAEENELYCVEVKLALCNTSLREILTASYRSAASTLVLFYVWLSLLFTFSCCIFSYTE